jgi:hypothetical protein
MKNTKVFGKKIVVKGGAGIKKKNSTEGTNRNW